MRIRQVSARELPGAPRRAAAVPAVLLVLLTSYVVTGSSDSPAVVHLPFAASVHRVTSTFMPQGWAFFTKPADSEMLVPFAVGDQGLDPLSVGVNGEPRFAFGLDRTSRVQVAELSLLLDGRGESTWHKCEGETHAQCLAEDDLPVGDAVNRLPAPTTCGRVAIFAEQVTPFEWRLQEHRRRIPTQVTVLDVRCPGRTA